MLAPMEPRLRLLDGEPLIDNPFHELSYVRDLEYFDGPLLSHYRAIRRGANASYLAYWCDCDLSCNRWMLVHVSGEVVLGVAMTSLSLMEALQLRLEPFVWIVDLANNRDMKQGWVIPFEKLPDDYLPQADAFISGECLVS